MYKIYLHPQLLYLWQFYYSNCNRPVMPLLQTFTEQMNAEWI